MMIYPVVTYKMRIVAAIKKIGSCACRFCGGDLVQLVVLCRCILMQFSRLFSVLYAVYIHAVSQKASVFNGFAVFVIR